MSNKFSDEELEAILFALTIIKHNPHLEILLGGKRIKMTAKFLEVSRQIATKISNHLQ